MKKLAIPLALAAVATLAGCGTMREMKASITHPQTQPAAAAPVTPVYTYATAPAPAPIPGVGTVVFLTDPQGPVNGISKQILTVRMRDGTTQIITQTGAQIAMGERVEITSDARIRPATRS